MRVHACDSIRDTHAWLSRPNQFACLLWSRSFITCLPAKHICRLLKWCRAQCGRTKAQYECSCLTDVNRMIRICRCFASARLVRVWQNINVCFCVELSWLNTGNNFQIDAIIICVLFWQPKWSNPRWFEYGSGGVT